MRTIAILGGGITGLALAWFIKQYKQQVSIKLFEASPRVGGWIQSDMIGNCLCERGPNTLRPRGEGIEALQLIEALGLEKEVITSSPQIKKKFIWRDGKLYNLPYKPWHLLYPGSSINVFRLLREYFKRRIIPPEESIANFIQARLGTRIMNDIFDPMVIGIYAGDIHQLSAPACFPTLTQWEKTHGSLIKGALARQDKPELSPFVQAHKKASIISFKDGMETLPIALAKTLKENIYLEEPVLQLHKDKGKMRLNTTKRELYVDQVISCLPAHALAPISHTLCPKLSSLLKEIPFKSISLAQVVIEKLKLPYTGFGYLIPSYEKQAILGAIFNPCIFPQRYPSNTGVFTFMLKGRQTESYAYERVVYALNKHLEILRVPTHFSLKVQSQAIPQYELGHLSRLHAMNESLRGLKQRFLMIGNSFQGVSVNLCIAKAKEIAKTL